MTNSDRFLAKYNEIHHHLCDVLHLGEEASFHEAITEGRLSIPPVRWRYADLNRCRELRNLLVHTRGERYIAEPTDQTVQMIEEVADLLANPPTVELFQTDVFRLQSSDPIRDAVEVMFERSYSQIPVYDDDSFTGLLTTNTVSRWLGSCVQDDIFSLEETPVFTVLHYAEVEDNYRFLSRHATLFEAIEAFNSHEKRGKRLESILITERGKPSESLLGIITIWDLPRIHQELAV